VAKGQVIDYTGQRRTRLLVLGPVPTELKRYKSNTKEWYCRCDCGVELQLETRMISGTGKYVQQSCGCIRVITHLVVTSKIDNLTLEFIEGFDDFAKYQFLHKSYVVANPRDPNWTRYSNFINHFYHQVQFNLVYDNWLTINTKNKTYYDWYKPSIDHKIPKSRGGGNGFENCQFLTVFENLAKRDMTEEEWDNFKITTNTKSDLFIREGSTNELLFST
jgi:hypothetical protein